MKKALSIVLMLALLVVGLAGCTERSAAEQEPQPNFAPLSYSTFEYFYQAVSDAQNSAGTMSVQTETAESGDIWLNDLTFFYQPAWIPRSAQLSSIRVRDRYVALYYTLDPSGDVEDPKNVFMFEWVRSPQTEQSFEGVIGSCHLTPHESDLVPARQGLYSCPIYSIGYQYYWLQDGYQFSMYVPDRAVDSSISFAAVQTNIPAVE